MEKSGEKLNPEIFTFRYPGREPKFLEAFLDIRSDVVDHYIYDINLTTGSLLYRSKGGIGMTKEPHIVRMHQWIKTSTVRRTLESTYKTQYREDIGKWRYFKLRESFNESGKDLSKWTDCAELYLLWAGSNFTHRYRLDGYDGTFFPTRIKYDALENASRVSREKNLLFRKEDLSSFAESPINDNVVVYSHLPREFGKFGAGWIWNQYNLERFTRVIRELSATGNKVLISAPFEVRNRVELDYRNYLPDFDYTVVPKFKEVKSLLSSNNSEIYLFNF